MSSLDRSKRDGKDKKKALADVKKKEKEQKKAEKNSKKDKIKRRINAKRRSAAAFETRSMLKMMALSSVILIFAFIILEIILLVWKSANFGPGDTSYTNNDVYWHLLNFSDTVLGFLIGLLAMDALTWYESGRKAKRDEERAIGRHNRIVKPAIDMYLARKNSLLTSSKNSYGTFQVKTDATIKDLMDIFQASTINSDAKVPRITSFLYYTKKLNVAFLNMAEDINFDYNPQICDAVLSFINETTYGMSALTTLASFAEDNNRVSKNALLRQIRSASENTEISDAEDELNIAMILIHTIHAQEAALEMYMEAIEDIDNLANYRS